MTRRYLRWSLGLVLVGLATTTAAVAQSANGGDEHTVAVGGEFRQYRLGSGADLTTIRQYSVPVALIWSHGRFGADLGAAWVDSRLSPNEGAAFRSVSGLTDTQIRLSYTFGSDLLVASVVANLPTGLSKANPQDFAVLGAISSSFLAFPVASHGSGFSTTGGLALAVPAGSWNLGIAGSVRASGDYTAYTDPSGDFTYKPGIEGRVRAGVDHIIGRSRITAGVTYSTFGTDEYGFGGAATGLYHPGGRWVAEGNVVAPIGSRASISVFGWHYQRAGGDSSGAVVANRERITAGGVSLVNETAGGIRLALTVDGRSAKIGDSPGHLIGGELALGLPLGRHLSFGPAARYDTGSLDPTTGKLDVRGYLFSVFIRSR